MTTFHIHSALIEELCFLSKDLLQKFCHLRASLMGVYSLMQDFFAAKLYGEISCFSRAWKIKMYLMNACKGCTFFLRDARANFQGAAYTP